MGISPIRKKGTKNSNNRGIAVEDVKIHVDMRRMVTVVYAVVLTSDATDTDRRFAYARTKKPYWFFHLLKSRLRSSKLRRD